MKAIICMIWCTLLPLLTGVLVVADSVWNEKTYGGEYYYIPYGIKKFIKIFPKSLKISDIIHGLISLSVVLSLEVWVIHNFQILRLNVFYYNNFIMPVLLTLMTIGIFLVLYIYSPTERLYDLPREKTKPDCIRLYVCLTIFFVLVILCINSMVSEVVKRELTNVEYNVVGERDIPLESFSGTLSTDGKVESRPCYIQVSVDSSYKLYYTTRVDDGSLIIDYIDYDKNRDKIFPGEEENPRIHVTAYQRELIDEHGEVRASSSYEKYEVYIPETPKVESLMP